MKANAGGNLQPQHVYGRDHFIEFLWQTLQSQSILQSGERRTGKTQILRKMLQQPKPGWKPVFHDLEKIHSALEFAELVYDDIQQFLGTATRAKNFIQRWFEHNETDYINLKGRTPDQQPALAVQQLKQHLAAGTSAPPDHDHLLQLLRLLDADHYITRDTLGHYHFRSQLIRRWWKLDRAL